MRSRAAAAAIGSGLLLMAACGTADKALPSNGPLDGGQDPYLNCLLERGSSDFTFGSGLVRNRGSADVELEGVSLIHARNFTLDGSFAGPLGGVLVGSWSRWPPPLPPGAAAPQLRPINANHGVKLDSVASGDAGGANLVVHLHRPDTSHLAHVDGLRVTYSVRGHRYTTDTSVALGISRTASSKTC